MDLIAVEKAVYKGGHRVDLVFNDGVAGVVNLADEEWIGLLAPLKDESYFKNFNLDAWPTLCWPNGADFAPEYLYKKVTGRHPDYVKDEA